MFTVFLFYKEKKCLTGKGCVGVVIPWQLCRTIGPLLSQRFPLACAKAQPRGGFLVLIQNYNVTRKFKFLVDMAGKGF